MYRCHFEYCVFIQILWHFSSVGYRMDIESMFLMHYYCLYIVRSFSRTTSLKLQTAPKAFSMQLNESHGFLMYFFISLFTFFLFFFCFHIHLFSQQEELLGWWELLAPLVFWVVWKRVTYSLYAPQLRVSCHFNLNEAGCCIGRGHQRCCQWLPWDKISWYLHFL